MNYQPFLTPLPLWADSRWPWLIIPLCFGVSVVYKSIKCRSMRTVPREAAVITFWILIMMSAAAAVLLTLVRMLER